MLPPLQEEQTITATLFSNFFQLLSDFLSPVIDQVPERISNFSNMLSSRAHVKSGIRAPFQVKMLRLWLSAESHWKCGIILNLSCLCFFPPPLHIIPPHHVLQTFSPGSLSSASSLAFGPPTSERSEGGLEKPETTRIDHCLLLKRKRRSTEEEEREESNSSEKKSKSGEITEEHKQTFPMSSSSVLFTVWYSFISEPTEGHGSLSTAFTDLLDPLDLECSLCMRWVLPD